MERQELVTPESKIEQILKPQITYTVPDTVWVIDAETKELLNLQEICLAEATKVILVPKVAGG